MFHLVNLPEKPGMDYNANSRENCLLWQQQIGGQIPLDDIYQVVYKFDLKTMNTLKTGAIPEEAKDNQMAEWLAGRYGQEALDFLILAKNCEYYRVQCLSPWYYPSKKDPVRYTLNDVAEMARQKANDPYYGDRYALQAVRAMTSLQQYEEIVRFWNENGETVSEEPIRRMLLSYVAGAYVHLNDMEQAISHYKQADDLAGLLECNLRYESDLSRVEKMELLYEVYPDCPDFRLKLWNILGHVEPGHDWNDDWHWEWNDSRPEITELGKLCDRVLGENTCADKALWAYAATYIAHLQGHNKEADHYLKTAESTVKDKDLADAIKMMRIYIDAQNSNYDKAYEQKLFVQLRWLQGMIENNIDQETVSDFSFYDLTSCYSYYYWNDAMRCLLLGTVCPKLMEKGNTTLALQLANMASYSLLNEISPNQHRRPGLYNGYDYCSHFAEMSDTLSANTLVAYAEIALKPQTEFQRFINTHSYIERDYLYEMIGTHMLREMRYADAERYLTQVSAGYFVRTNVYLEGYLNRDPFVLKHEKWNHGADAKLYFARKMKHLEEDIAATDDPNQKALLMIDYSIGLRNSFDYCWALTHYRLGWTWSTCTSYDWPIDDPNTKLADQKAERLLIKALNSFTDDEYAAQAQLLFCNFSTVSDRYPETLAARIVRGHCDVLFDYHAERKN